jgi:hypothetical protein
MQLLDSEIGIVDSGIKGIVGVIEKKRTKSAGLKPVSMKKIEAPIVAKVGPIWMDTCEFRKQRNETQSEFWARFGVTQSAGSRYEIDSRSTPKSVLMLVIAFALGIVSQDDLERLNEASKEVDD